MALIFCQEQPFKWTFRPTGLPRLGQNTNVQLFTDEVHVNSMFYARTSVEQTKYDAVYTCINVTIALLSESSYTEMDHHLAHHPDRQPERLKTIESMWYRTSKNSSVATAAQSTTASGREVQHWML